MSPCPSQHAPGYQKLMETVIGLIALTLGEKRGKIKPNTPLFSAQDGFDSIALLEFILRLEDTFKVSLPDEDLDPDIFYSPETIVSTSAPPWTGGIIRVRTDCQPLKHQ
jgi:acyl carrier protein